MDASALFRSLLRSPAAHRTALFIPPSRPQSRTFALQAQHARFLSLPTIIRPSFWVSMIPKPFKPSSASTTTTSPPTPRKEWNPYTPYIILSLLVGSQAIQILWLKQERAHSLRKAEARIGILREVIERVQSGELGCDVEGLLGTGDAASEKEWMEVLKDAKAEESLFQSKQRRKALRDAARLEEEKAEGEGKIEETTGGEEALAKMKVESFGGGKFY